MLKFTSLSSRSVLTLLGASLLLLAPAYSQQPAAPVRDYSASDATSEFLPKYKTAVDAKQYDVALALLDTQLTKVPSESYDTALLLQIKVQTLLQKGDFSKVIEPLERGLALSDSKTPTYYEERATRDFLFFLAQLCLQEAVNTKNPAAAATLYEKRIRPWHAGLSSILNRPLKLNSSTRSFFITAPSRSLITLICL